MSAAPFSTTHWTEAAIVGTASLMLTQEHQTPERVVKFIERMAVYLPPAA